MIRPALVNHASSAVVSVTSGIGFFIMPTPYRAGVTRLARTMRAMSKRRVTSGSRWEPEYGFSRAVALGDRIEIAGTAPIPPEGEPLAATAYGQMLRCGEIAIAALEELGATTDDVVRTRMYITDAADADDVGKAHRELFGDAAPAATMVVVAGLVDPGWKVELEVEAASGSDGADRG